LGIRATYSLIYSIDHSPSINPITGAFAVKLILVFLVQLIAVLLLIARSWFSRDIARNHLARDEPSQLQIVEHGDVEVAAVK
jgi:hypothetical protein